MFLLAVGPLSVALEGTSGMMLWKHVAYCLRLAELYFLMAWWWDADGFEAYASVASVPPSVRSRWPG